MSSDIRIVLNTRRGSYEITVDDGLPDAYATSSSTPEALNRLVDTAVERLKRAYTPTIKEGETQ